MFAKFFFLKRPRGETPTEEAPAGARKRWEEAPSGTPARGASSVVRLRDTTEVVAPGRGVQAGEILPKRASNYLCQNLKNTPGNSAASAR